MLLFPIKLKVERGPRVGGREEDIRLKFQVPAIPPSLCKYLPLLNLTYIIHGNLSGGSYGQKLKHCPSTCQFTVPLISDMLTGNKEKQEELTDYGHTVPGPGLNHLPTVSLILTVNQFQQLEPVFLLHASPSPAAY